MVLSEWCNRCMSHLMNAPLFTPICYLCAPIHLFLNHLMYCCTICNTFVHPHKVILPVRIFILESNIYLSKVNILVSTIHYSSTCEHAHTFTRHTRKSCNLKQSALCLSLSWNASHSALNWCWVRSKPSTRSQNHSSHLIHFCFLIQPISIRT